MGRIETGDLFETEESCGNGVSCGVVWRYVPQNTVSTPVGYGAGLPS